MTSDSGAEDVTLSAPLLFRRWRRILSLIHPLQVEMSRGVGECLPEEETRPCGLACRLSPVPGPAKSRQKKLGSAEFPVGEAEAVLKRGTGMSSLLQSSRPGRRQEGRLGLAPSQAEESIFSTCFEISSSGSSCTVAISETTSWRARSNIFFSRNERVFCRLRQ